MTHGYHQGLEDYNPEAILQDGCEECERRAEEGLGGALALDPENLAILWRLMIDFEHTNPPTQRPKSRCDRLVVGELHKAAMVMERLGWEPW